MAQKRSIRSLHSPTVSGEDSGTDAAPLGTLMQRQETLITLVIEMHRTLRLLLDAATQPPEKSELGDTLEHIANRLAGQQQSLATLNDRVAGLPEAIADAIGSVIETAEC